MALQRGYNYGNYDYGYTYPYAGNVSYDVNNFPSVVTETNAPAQLDVLVPTPDARVLIDGQPTTTPGTDRIFETLALTPGTPYKYTITASWEEGGTTVTRDMPVTVMARRQPVDLTHPAGDTAPPAGTP